MKHFLHLVGVLLCFCRERICTPIDDPDLNKDLEKSGGFVSPTALQNHPRSNQNNEQGCELDMQADQKKPNCNSHNFHKSSSISASKCVVVANSRKNMEVSLLRFY